MERPNHLHTAGQTNSSRLTGLAIVIAIHVLAVTGLVTALAGGQILKEIKDIKASVDRDKPVPKAPPPPPPDLVKPPPPSIIIPTITLAPEAPPPVTVQKAAPPPPKAAPVAAATELKALGRTHVLPPYPTISVRMGEHGTSGLLVTIGTDGNVKECKLAKSSGSDRLDQAACEFVKAKWRWQPPTAPGGVPVEATTAVNIVWDLKDAQ